MPELGKILLEESQSLQPQLQEWRRQLHQHPELELDLPKTKKFVVERLQEMGYEPQEVGKGGISALVGGKHPGKVYLLRGDMDALPIQEETDVDYTSQESGCMHACGHDLHTAMLLGAAKLLKEHEDEIQGTIKLMFQPGEETLTGAKDMIEAGILDAPKVDAAMMIHVLTGAPIEVGTITLEAPNAGYSSSDVFEITICGHSSHGAVPQESIDPINAACHVFLALQTLNSREIDPCVPFVLTVGAFQGGTVCNQIPETVRLLGSLRTLDNDCRIKVKKRMEEIAVTTASAFGAKVEVAFGANCPMAVNNGDQVASARKALTALFGENGFIDKERAGDNKPKIGGSEDFGFVCEQVPGLILTLGAGDFRDGCSYGMHHPKAVFDDSCLFRGTAAYVMCAMNWLSEHSSKEKI